MRLTLTDSPYTQVYFTAPLDGFRVRRGDSLGFRRVADAYGALLAPSLTNRAYDARWISILCWCLREAKGAARYFGLDVHGALDREDAKVFYRTVRPLELLWIARTLELDERNKGKQRQLPGRRAVERWLNDERPERLGQSIDQQRAYRFNGPYGIYRGLLRRLKGLTEDGDGWRIGPNGDKLAEIVSEAIPHTTDASGGRGKRLQPEAYWRQHWHRWNRRGAGRLFVPHRWDPTHGERLTADEQRILGGLFFGSGNAAERRRKVAELCASSRADSHAELCEDVAAGLSSLTEGPPLSLLTPLDRLADAGVSAMTAVWNAFTESRRDPKLALDRVLTSEVATTLDVLNRCAMRWTKARGTRDLDLFMTPNRLAASIVRARTDRDRLRELVQHHLVHGGGRRWFVLADEHLARNMTSTGGTSGYGFRLWPLARIAVQCGVIERFPRALVDEANAVVREEEDA